MKEDSQLLYSIALMYYQDGLSQEEISKHVGISRPSVSRCLAKALKTGIIEIKINAPQIYTDKSTELEKALGLEKVCIAPSSVTDYAATVLEKELAKAGNVGIGWGKTVYKTVQKMAQLELSKNDERSIVPLVSSMGIKEPHYQVNLMVSLMTDAIGGIPYFHNPADSRMRELKELWSHLDVAVMGLGPGKYSRNGSPENDAIKGEILGKFFTSDGFIDYKWEGYDGIDKDLLLKIKKRICMCVGSEKIDAIITACQLGLFNILITDIKTTEELYARVCKGNKK